jgi:hypothetical protein
MGIRTIIHERKLPSWEMGAEKINWIYFLRLMGERGLLHCLLFSNIKVTRFTKIDF